MSRQESKDSEYRNKPVLALDVRIQHHFYSTLNEGSRYLFELLYSWTYSISEWYTLDRSLGGQIQ